MSFFPLRRLLLPLILIAVAVLLRSSVPGLDPDYRKLLDWLPYVTLGLALGLCIYYNRARLFTVMFAFLFVYYLVQFELQSPLTDFRALFIFTSVSVGLPLTLLLLFFLPERGLRNRYGVPVISIVPLQLLMAIIIFNTVPEAELTSAIDTWFPIRPYENYLLSVNASFCFAVVALSGLLKLCRDDNEYSAALLSSLLVGYITLAWFFLPKISVVMFSVAGVSQIVSLLRSSYEMAYLDELTGLLGRRALNELLKGLGRRYVIAMTDVDHFKKFNDTWGHDTGDEVLKMVARQVAAVRGGGTAYRYGGEEFCIVFPGKNIDYCRPYLETVRSTVENYRMIVRDIQQRTGSKKTARQRRGRRAKNRGGKFVSVTISIGMAEPEGRNSKVDEVLKAADTALYKAKKDGRNCIRE